MACAAKDRESQRQMKAREEIRLHVPQFRLRVPTHPTPRTNKMQTWNPFSLEMLWGVPSHRGLSQTFLGTAVQRCPAHFENWEGTCWLPWCKMRCSTLSSGLIYKVGHRRTSSTRNPRSPKNMWRVLSSVALFAPLVPICGPPPKGPFGVHCWPGHGAEPWGGS